MKDGQVVVGGTYLTKVGTRSVEVRVERENPKGGWDAISVTSGKPIRVKDAGRLRPAKADAAPEEGAGAAPAAADGDVAPVTTKPGKGAKGAGRAKGKAGPKARPPTAPATKEKAPKRTSCLDAAAAVLKAEGQPMRCKELVAAMRDKGLWSSDAPTPEATLYSAILREIAKKESTSRFKKTGRGRFALNA